ncbi:MAG: radical SAM/SPASM domain-containing protein [Planctomycetota bacterium]
MKASNSDIRININYHEIYKSERYLTVERDFDEAYREYRRQWHENPKQGIVAPFPLHLSLETTNLCNLHCPMCARTLKAKQGLLDPPRFMDYTIFTQIIDEGAAHGLKAIKLNAGDSEPLIAKDISERVRYAKERGILEVMINTNATLLTKKTSSELIEAGLDRLLVSFDSPNKKKYEEIRVGANFDKVVTNLRNFAKIRRDRQRPVLRLSMVKMTNNQNEIKAFKDMWRGTADILAVLDYQNPQGMDESSRAAYKPSLKANFCCSQLWQRLQVRVDGTVTPCCGDYLNKLKLGNAENERIIDLWMGQKLNRLRELHRSGCFSEIATCRSCGLARLPENE